MKLTVFQKDTENYEAQLTNATENEALALANQFTITKFSLKNHAYILHCHKQNIEFLQKSSKHKALKILPYKEEHLPSIQENEQKFTVKIDINKFESYGLCTVEYNKSIIRKLVKQGVFLSKGKAIDIVYNIIHDDLKFKTTNFKNIKPLDNQFIIPFKIDMSNQEEILNAENKLKPAIEQALNKMLFSAQLFKRYKYSF